MSMKLFPWFVLLFITGCTSNIRWTPYVGQQQAWPTEPGAFVRTNGLPIPIYIGRPNKPYDVVGTITSPLERRAAGIAKSHGAQALLEERSETVSRGTLHHGGTATVFPNGMIVAGPRFSQNINDQVVTYTAIKFK